MLSFKQTIDFDARKKESTKIREKYPTKIPLIAEKGKNTDLKCADKKKYLINEDMTLAQFMVVLRKRLSLTHTDALFVYVGDNTLATASTPIVQLYEKHKDPDGFLYLTYCSENTFGV